MVNFLNYKTVIESLFRCCKNTVSSFIQENVSMCIVHKIQLLYLVLDNEHHSQENSVNH